MHIFSERDIRQVVDVNRKALELVEEGFQKLERGEVTMPPVLRVDIPEHHGEVDVKTAYVKGMDMFALKMSSGFFDNPDKGLPSLSGMMLLLRTDTGFTDSILQDNGYLTDVRTAAAGGIAAAHLAPETVETAGVIGTGTQARYQIRALQLVRKLDQVLVYGRKSERVQEYIDDMQKELGIEVKATESPEEVVRNSDAVVTTTPAKQPIIQKEWLHPGLHITAMGSDAEEKNEVAPDVLGAVDVLACDAKAQVFKLGEHHHALEAGVIQENADTVELGALSLGHAGGRTSNEDVTFCDLTGTGVQDTAIAVYARQSLVDAGKGTTFET
ncbi:cyclodeaminase [Salibacterium lacus]|uniref:Cyclodeaminase n=1 Tax=Salibacterium lacus TaxID=1898109 RepID=A0ABW5T4Z4_9BACI